MRRCGDLGATKRGELRLLEPRIPGTGALFFCGQPPVAHRPGNPYKNEMGNASPAAPRGKSDAIEGYGTAAK